MNPVILQKQASDGKLWQATFLPEKGMNLISLKKGEFELIEQSTKQAFDERFGGLGPLIGPHFHRRPDGSITKVPNEDLFPHIAFSKAHGSADPFSHGIGRYAPWKVESTSSSIKAILTGKDLWNGVALSALEGQNFTMRFNVDLKENGLFLDLSIVSDTDSLVGIHYYLTLPHSRGKLEAKVRDHYFYKGKKLSFPANWSYSNQLLQLDLNQEIDFTFHSVDPLKGSMTLMTDSYRLKMNYESVSQENCFQVYHPSNASYVCLEPISAQDPSHPNLTVSGIKIHIDV